ncbi:MAG: hypothetical protein ACR2NA_03950 [Solirubrobacterales bacterium]
MITAPSTEGLLPELAEPEVRARLDGPWTTLCPRTVRSRCATC